MKLREYIELTEKSSAIKDAVKAMTKIVASEAKGKIITFVSHNGSITSLGYDDSEGERHVIFSTKEKLSDDEEKAIIAKIRKKYSK